MPWLYKSFKDDAGHASIFVCDQHADELLNEQPDTMEYPWEYDDDLSDEMLYECERCPGTEVRNA